jgi:hypothetical protein
MSSPAESGTGQEGDASLYSEGLCALDVRRYMTDPRPLRGITKRLKGAR